MDVSVENIINVRVDSAWIGVAAELVATFPKDAGPRDRLRLLFNGLHQRLGITDWIACATVHSRVSALGFMDQTMQLADLHSAGSNPDAHALRQAVATVPLNVEDENLAFNPVSFQRCFAQARQGEAASRKAGLRQSKPAAGSMSKANKARTAKALDGHVQTLLLASLGWKAQACENVR